MSSFVAVSDKHAWQLIIPSNLPSLLSLSSLTFSSLSKTLPHFFISFFLLLPLLLSLYSVSSQLFLHIHFFYFLFRENAYQLFSSVIFLR